MGNPPLAVIPVRDGELAPGGAEAVAEAGGRAVLIGSGAATTTALDGVATSMDVVVADGFAPAAWSEVLAPIVADAAFVVLPASPDGRDLAPRLAALLGWPLLAGAVRVTPELVVVARHGGLVEVDLRPSGQFVATLQPGVRGIGPAGPAPSVTVLEVTPGPGVDPVVLEVFPPDAATMDLAEARRIVGGGAGLMTGDAAARFAVLAALGEAFGASMGATRVVTDAGLVPHTRQIGTTGVVVDPDLYLAFGISGAVQHTAGLGNPDHVISVNTDPHCPMMGLADLAIVADANETIEILAERLGVPQRAVAGRG